MAYLPNKKFEKKITNHCYYKCSILLKPLTQDSQPFLCEKLKKYQIFLSRTCVIFTFAKPPSFDYKIPVFWALLKNQLQKIYCSSSLWVQYQNL